MSQVDRSLWCIYLLFFAVAAAVAKSVGMAVEDDPAADRIAPDRIATDLAYQEPEIAPSDRDHWAFRPLQPEAALPSVKDIRWPKVAFDFHILRDIESAGLEPTLAASPATLLRRLKLDLLGLPSTPEELDEFLSDCDAHGCETEAYAEWVERFLASPQFGERWAQVWLDLARFAETDGFEHDRVRKDAWRYRDWVVHAINDDMPYNEFVRHQLTGENSENGAHRIATMFALAGPDMPDINDQELRRHDRLNEMTSTLGSALLGLQFQCAQCHDHKYDPISQGDFYRLRAIFESAVPILQRDQAYVLFDPTSKLTTAQSFLYLRGEVRHQGPAVEAGLPRIATEPSTQPKKLTSHQPRQEFVQWLFEPNHPLTARVMVNRIWQSHFGKGLFENPSDVGVSAAAPTNLKALDSLANDFRTSGWSMKSIHRQIVLSSTYRQASRNQGQDHAMPEAWAKKLAVDPDNRLYSRFPRRRLDAEVIRDSMLSVSGLLHYQSGGEGVMPPLPDECTKTLLKGQWTTSLRRQDHFRRSVYTFARRNLRYPMLDVFDRPDAGASCAKRDCSTTAIQSLQMLNSDFTLDCSQSLRDAILKADSGSASNTSNLAAIHRLFKAVLGRKPTIAEESWVQEFLDRQPNDVPGQWLSVCTALLNTNEFVYIE
ncbi:MAG: DUF1549 and DUF1553 domain-containing protein [Pirellula sp.]